ncbi:MAG: acetyl-CoA C-acetyltransferase, partial [Clostridiales bacterium]|nr:acetyl-CoA C-acetyltransferase [Clostridiales bacterium]
MREVVIVEACRTAVGSIGGTLKKVPAEELARVVVQGILDRSKIDPKEINEVIMGHCRQTSDNPNIARIAALRCGIPEEVPAQTVMRQCASAMTAVLDGVMSIQVGDNDVVLAGGTESMSTAVFYVRGARYGLGTGNTTLVDALTEGQFQSQPQETYGTFNMGETADNVAAKMNISREDADAFALQSQLRAAKAIKEGKFKDEIVPVVVPQRKSDPIVFEVDEFPRETSAEKLAKLKPAFTKDGVTTAGNSSGRNDGASAMLIMSADKAKELGLKPLARFVSYATTGLDPRIMGLGPVEATKKALKRANMKLEDMELIELNEAFAAQSIGCIRELGVNQEICNVNGGAIALGHPVGSSGCRIMVTLLYEMRRRKNKYGLASLCIAGGMGQAT